MADGNDGNDIELKGYDDGEDDEGSESDVNEEQSEVVIDEGEELSKAKKPFEKQEIRITSNFLTKYERARVLGTRAL